MPGLLCFIGTQRSRDRKPIDIYGPEGTRVWLRNCIRYSTSRIAPPYVVHELIDIPLAPTWKSPAKGGGGYRFVPTKAAYSGGVGRRAGGTTLYTKDEPASYVRHARGTPPSQQLAADIAFGEMSTGRDILPIYGHPLSAAGAPVWVLEESPASGSSSPSVGGGSGSGSGSGSVGPGVSVYAAPLSHGVPCVGYACVESDRPGRLKVDVALPLVTKHAKALSIAGMRDPLKVLARLKELKEGEVYTFPGGETVSRDDVQERGRKGRTIVILGDTCDASPFAKLAKGADVLVHEATNCYLPEFDGLVSTEQSVRRETVRHGHSTPKMAGEFARKVGARRLVLNHFSPRYRGDIRDASLRTMRKIEDIARDASGLKEKDVVAAWDFLVVNVAATYDGDDDELQGEGEGDNGRGRNDKKKKEEEKESRTEKKKRQKKKQQELLEETNAETNPNPAEINADVL